MKPGAVGGGSVVVGGGGDVVGSGGGDGDGGSIDRGEGDHEGAVHPNGAYCLHKTCSISRRQEETPKTSPQLSNLCTFRPQWPESSQNGVLNGCILSSK